MYDNNLLNIQISEEDLSEEDQSLVTSTCEKVLNFGKAQDFDFKKCKTRAAIIGCIISGIFFNLFDHKFDPQHKYFDIIRNRRKEANNDDLDFESRFEELEFLSHQPYKVSVNDVEG